MYKFIVIFSLAAAACFAGLPKGQGVFLLSPEVDIHPVQQEEMIDVGFTTLYISMGKLEEPLVPVIKGSLKFNVYFITAVRNWAELSGSDSRVLSLYKSWKSLFIENGASVGGLILAVDDVSGDPPASIAILRNSLNKEQDILALSPGKEISYENQFDLIFVRAQGFSYPATLDPSLVMADHITWVPEASYVLGFHCSPVVWKVALNGSASEILLDPDIDKLTTAFGVSGEVEALTLGRTGSYHTYRIERAYEWEGSILNEGEKIRVMLPNFPQTVRFAARRSRLIDENYRGFVFGPFPQDQDQAGIFFQALQRAFAGVAQGPDVDVWLSARKGGYVIKAVNKSPFPSDIHFEKSVISWKVGRGAINSASPGMFDKYRYVRGEEEVPRASADTLKLFEFYIAPHELWESGIIRISGGARGTITVQLYLTDGTVRSRTFEAKEILQ